MTDLDKIKAINIIDIASRLGISTRRVGENYNSVCPFHSEKIPSFILFGSTNSWHCFGNCQDGGSNIDLVMKSRNSDFNSALQWMESQYGTVEEEENIEVKFKLSGPSNNFQHKIVRNDILKYWHNSLFNSGRDAMFIDRGFTSETIKNEGFGWNGERYVIPIWQDKPWQSNCIGVRLKASELCKEDAFKYIGKKGYNKPCMYNRHTVNDSNYMFVFAGELDAKLCSQDGFSAVSLVNGMTSFSSFRKAWPHLWFPTVKYIFVVFDRKEAHVAGKMATEWERQKGRNTAYVIHWPNELLPLDNQKSNGYDDYNDFRLTKTGDIKKFLSICQSQIQRIGIKL